MINQDVISKAFACSENYERYHCPASCSVCEYYNPHGSCSIIYGYIFGFADGIEEGKRLYLEFLRGKCDV